MFDPTSSHPSRELLQVFRSGTLDNPNEMDAISRHLDECPKCLQTLEALAGDTLENLIQRAYGGAESAHESNIDLSFLEPPQTPEELGRLGQYRILKILGQGGMGMVFHAEDTQLERLIALKVIRPEATRKPEARERFFREAKLAASIEHDHIVPVFHAGEANGIPFIAMPYLKGISLADYLQDKGALSIPEVLRMGREMALGLSVAHARGLIHRDIQPANLWIEPHHGDRIKILDFGLARILDRDKTKLTQSGIILGTPAFMSPEQAQAKPVGPACDLFALGVVMYRLATGRMPFEGDNVTSLLVAVVTQNPPAPHTINPDVPQPLSELIMELLDKDENKRPESATYVADRLLQLEQVYKPDAPPMKKPRRFGFVKGFLTMGFLAALLAVAAVFYFQPKQGVVRVEIHDDGIEASLTKTGIVIKKADDASEIRLTPGEQSLKVKKGELEFETQKFTLKKGETITLKVELLAEKLQVLQGDQVIGEKALPKKYFTDLSTAELDAEYYAAKAIMDSGGKVNLNYGHVWRFDLSHFPGPYTPFRVIGANLSGSFYTDYTLAGLRNCPTIEVLDLSYTRVTDEGLRVLQNCPNVKELYLSGTAITDKGMETIALLKNLKKLNLTGTSVTDKGLKWISRHNQLEIVYLWKTNVTQKGAAELFKALPSCEIVQAASQERAVYQAYRSSGTSILEQDGTTVEVYGRDGMPKGNWTLIGVRFGVARWVNDETILEFVGLKELKELELNYAKLTEVGIEDLARIPNLEILSLEGVKVRDSGLRHLKVLTKMKSLNLTFSGITDAGVKELAAMPELETLNLSRNKLSDESLKILSTFKNLKKLILEGTEVTESGILEFRKARPECTLLMEKERPTYLPQPPTFVDPPKKKDPSKRKDSERDVAEWILSVGGSFENYNHWQKPITKIDQIKDSELRIYVVTLPENPKIKAEDYARFKFCRSLNHIQITGSIDDEGLKNLSSSLPPGDTFTNRWLTLNKTQVTDEGLVHLKNLHCLYSLSIKDSTLSGEGLAHLKECEKLSSLSFINMKIDEKKLLHLKAIPNLTSISFGSVSLSDVGVKHICECEKLQSLWLYDSPITDAHIRSLTKCKSVTRLSLSGTLITDEGLENLTELSKLSELIVRKTKVTEKGVEKLQKELPTCEILLTTTDAYAARWIDNLRIGDMLLDVGGKRVQFRKNSTLPKEEFKIIGIDVSNSKDFNDYMPPYIVGLKHLVTLDLFKTGLTTKGVQELGNFPVLESLILEGVPVTDEGLKSLKNLTKLKNLNLADTKITDGGLKEIARLTSLTKLNLSANKITDEGLKELVNLKQLQTLTLEKTEVTEKGIAELQKALPDCKIISK